MSGENITKDSVETQSMEGELHSLKNSVIEIEIEKNKYKADILNKPLNQKDYKNS